MNPVIRHALLGVMAVAALCAVAAAGYYRSARRLQEAQDSTQEVPTAVTTQAHGLAATDVEQGSAAEEAEELLRLREQADALRKDLDMREEAVQAWVRGKANPSAVRPETAPVPRPQVPKVRSVTLAELREQDPRSYEIIRVILEGRRRKTAKKIEERGSYLANLNPAYLPERDYEKLRGYLEDVQQLDTAELDAEAREKLKQKVLDQMFQVMPLARRYDYAAQGKDADAMERLERALGKMIGSPNFNFELPRMSEEAP